MNTAEWSDIPRDQLDTQQALAYWYACGYNDNRADEAPYVDPFNFAQAWVAVFADTGLTYRPPMRDLFNVTRDGIEGAGE